MVQFLGRLGSNLFLSYVYITLSISERKLPISCFYSWVDWTRLTLAKTWHITFVLDFRQTAAIQNDGNIKVMLVKNCIKFVDFCHRKTQWTINRETNSTHRVCGRPYLTPIPTRGRALMTFFTVALSWNANMIAANTNSHILCIHRDLKTYTHTSWQNPRRQQHQSH